MSKPLWKASKSTIEQGQMHAFRLFLNQRLGLSLANFQALYDYSIRERAEFWSGLWDFHGVKGNKGKTIIEHPDDMLKSRFFTDSTFNFAENLLVKNDDTQALIFKAEDKESFSWTWRQLHAHVSLYQQLFLANGIEKGDRIAAMVSNRPETVALMLAAASLGAIWSSCSPDFGVEGVLSRFSQIEPKLFITVNGYYYAGKTIDNTAKIEEIVSKLPSLKAAFCLPVIHDTITKNTHNLNDVIKKFKQKPVEFTSMAFNAPLYILFSSGTTGIPKCIVHGGGGVLMQHIKEQKIHCNITENSRFFYFTTCGWMMWNWLVSGLATGATVLLYDGSPFHPHNGIVFDFLQETKATFFGTSAKYLETANKFGLEPMKTHDLSSVKTIASTGSPLTNEGFHFVYEKVKSDVHLASISGGTDICASFVGGTAELPVYIGEIQTRLLAMATDVFNDDGQPVREEKGELVCSKSFPSLPLGFWGDPTGEKYRAAYFNKFDKIWCHGDYAEITKHNGMIIYGRSDATLNPGGVRIGTAEIYAQTEKVEEVLETIAIGQEWQGDTRIVLFVKMKPNFTLNDDVKIKLKNQIKMGASPRHVPSVILEVADIPRTKSGKITELAVRDIVHGKEIKNQEALANAESLAYFKNRAELV